MKTSKITRTFVFVLGAIAATGSAEGMEFSQVTNIPRDAVAYVPAGTVAGGITLTKTVTLTATAAGEATAGVGGWISVSTGTAGAPTFPATPWTDDANTGTIGFSDDGAIVAHGGFEIESENTYRPFIPGIRTGITLTNVTLPTSWNVAGGNRVTGAVRQDFDGTGEALTSNIIAGSGNTVTMALEEGVHHLATNQLYKAPELELPVSTTIAAAFVCGRADELTGGRIAPEADVTPIRARAVLGAADEVGGTCTLSGDWSGFEGSHFVVGGTANATATDSGTLEITGAGSLPQSDITVLGRAALTLGSGYNYVTGADSVVDLRGCREVSGGTSLTLGANGKLIF